MTDAYALTECVVALVVLAFCLRQFRRLRRDDFRSDIRRLRDALFDDMWRNGYSFDDPAYRGMRRVLNGTLRASESVCPLYVICAAIWHEIGVRRGIAKDDPVPLAHNRAIQEKITKVRMDAATRFLEFVFLEGVFGWFMKSLLISSRLVTLFARFKDRFRRDSSTLLLQEGYRLGNPHLSREEAAVFGH